VHFVGLCCITVFTVAPKDSLCRNCTIISYFVDRPVRYLYYYSFMAPSRHYLEVVCLLYFPFLFKV